MNLAGLFSSYILLQFLIVVAWAILRISSRYVTSSQALKLNYGAFFLVVGFTVTPFVFSKVAPVWTPAEIFAASPGKSGSSLDLISMSAVNSTGTIKVAHASYFLSLGIMTLGLVGAFLLIRDLGRTAAILRRSFRIRKVGRVHILVSAGIPVPFSFWLPGRAWILMPLEMIAQSSNFRLAIAHEIQHHRQGDTQMIHWFWWLKKLSLLNPMMHLWFRQICEMQEFACDEALIGRPNFQSRDYIRCLVEVAQTAVAQKSFPVCAAGLFLGNRQLLKRRIMKMINLRVKGTTSFRAAVLALTVLMGMTAYAGRGFVQDRRVTMSQAVEIAKASQDADFPIVMNESVLQWLNYYVGTQAGRKTMKESLARMESYRPMVEGKLKDYEMPDELMAIPLIESGYQNITQRPPGQSAGIWQFIGTTARAFGLRVDHREDQRLNETILTDAAMRYLLSNKLRFNDWHLSVLSFNMGEEAVQRGINKTGYRDAWSLIKAGYEGDRGYLPKVIAAILIMKNPEILN